MVGGYKVIDLKNINITTKSVEIPGIYYGIESSIGKPLLIRNIIIDGYEYHSTYSSVHVGGGSVYLLPVSITSGGYITFVRVDQNDGVIKSVYSPSTAGDPPVSDEDGPSASM